MTENSNIEAAGMSASIQPSSPLSGVRKNRSAVWDHFDVENATEKKAKCKYCGSLIQYGNGTSSMGGHLRRCKQNPNNDSNKRRKTTTTPTIDERGVLNSPSASKFDQEEARRALVEMFIGEELPFRFVESPKFRKFVHALQARFKVPSRTTLARDIGALYAEEKMKLQDFLSANCGRVCLTTDTWTSIQNFTYMSLTAHFIDLDWKLHKKILNFCQVTSHSGEVIGATIESCLNNWNLNRVFSVTVDNASSNDVAIKYLKQRLNSWNSIILNGEFIHMRCCAHIINLIVKEGLKEIDESVLRIRSAVKYVRSSPSRASRFQKCVELEKIQYKGLPCMDVETRWNSTYQILEVALKHRKAFELLALKDNTYIGEMNGGKRRGVPSDSDWEYAESIVPFLRVFNDATIRVSGALYVTSDMYMKEVFAIGRFIRHSCDSVDFSTMSMAERMRVKYEKYWGNPDSVNMLLLIAIVLNPMQKIEYVNYFLDYFFGEEKGGELKSKLSKCIKLLYQQYQSSEEASEADTQDVQANNINTDLHGMGFFLQATGRRTNTRSELDRYLQEECEPYSHKFDILNWWKVNSTRFPILGNMAREVLAIPVSTVASESAFSTGGRVLDPYRSSLTPRMVEALVCTGDWLKEDLFSALDDDDEVLQQVDQDIFSSNDGACSMAASIDNLDDD
ncbi:zinc finger BED domain-containing protein RICESLEEPER 2-like [Arachis stenosperma]|uniref:zinc finger BED domain-containing protein RICESLEEPER 2-like n=1 Tax=Arachis stenosperma TaxID=217475 RepID=UPI0025ABA5C4|nr:zinc finger BED domain-containing protein RICESLEEPER 2-like [Arachis stenosperma]